MDIGDINGCMVSRGLFVVNRDIHMSMCVGMGIILSGFDFVKQ